MNVMDAVCENSEESGKVEGSAFPGTGSDGSPNILRNRSTSSAGTDSSPIDRQLRNSRRFVRAGMGGSFKTPYEMRGAAASARSWRTVEKTNSFDSPGAGIDLSPSRKGSLSRSFKVKEPEAYQLLEDHLEPHLSAGENAVNLVKAMMEVRRVASGHQEQGNDDKGLGFVFLQQQLSLSFSLLLLLLPCKPGVLFGPPFIEQKCEN